MQHVYLKSGVMIKFSPEKCRFEFNERGYFVGDVYIITPYSRNGISNGEKVSSLVESFTFHLDEISCHWLE